MSTRTSTTTARITFTTGRMVPLRVTRPPSVRHSSLRAATVRHSSRAGVPVHRSNRRNQAGEVPAHRSSRPTRLLNRLRRVPTTCTPIVQATCTSKTNREALTNVPMVAGILVATTARCSARVKTVSAQTCGRTITRIIPGLRVVVAAVAVVECGVVEEDDDDKSGSGPKTNSGRR